WWHQHYRDQTVIFVGLWQDLIIDQPSNEIGDSLICEWFIGRVRSNRQRPSRIEAHSIDSILLQASCKGTSDYSGNVVHNGRPIRVSWPSTSPKDDSDICKVNLRTALIDQGRVSVPWTGGLRRNLEIHGRCVGRRSIRWCDWVNADKMVVAEVSFG